MAERTAEQYSEYPGLAPGIDRTPRRKTLHCHSCGRTKRVLMCRSVFNPDDWGPCHAVPGWTIVLSGGKKAGTARLNYYLCPECAA